MAEWLKAVDCKSIRILFHRFESYFLQLAKLNLLLFYNILISTIKKHKWLDV